MTSAEEGHPLHHPRGRDRYGVSRQDPEGFGRSEAEIEPGARRRRAFVNPPQAITFTTHIHAGASASPAAPQRVEATPIQGTMLEWLIRRTQARSRAARGGLNHAATPRSAQLGSRGHANLRSYPAARRGRPQPQAMAHVLPTGGSRANEAAPCYQSSRRSCDIRRRQFCRAQSRWNERKNRGAHGGLMTQAGGGLQSCSFYVPSD